MCLVFEVRTTLKKVVIAWHFTVSKPTFLELTVEVTGYNDTPESQPRENLIDMFFFWNRNVN